MANYDQRQALDYRFGQLSAGIDALGTTLQSPAFASLPSDLSSVKYVPITIADDSLGVYEIVWAVAHSAGSTSITVVRGREETSGRAWGSGAVWRIAPTKRDTIQTLAKAALPADAHLGMEVIVSDAPGLTAGSTQAAAWKKTASGWVPAAAGVRNYTVSTVAASGTQTGTPITLMQFTIPDPGFPFLLLCSGAAAWQIGEATRYDLAVRRATANGDYLSLVGVGPNGNTAGGGLKPLEQRVAAAFPSGPFTGAQVILLVLSRISGSNGVVVDTFNAGLFAQVIPAA